MEKFVDDVEIWRKQMICEIRCFLSWALKSHKKKIQTKLYLWKEKSLPLPWGITWYLSMLCIFSPQNVNQFEAAKPKHYTLHIAFFAKNFTKDPLSIETENRTQGKGFCGGLRKKGVHAKKLLFGSYLTHLFYFVRQWSDFYYDLSSPSNLLF